MIKIVAFGERAIRTIFLRISIGSVEDLFLYRDMSIDSFHRRIAYGNLLDEIKDRYSIANWTKDRVAIGREDQVAPAVDCATKVGELWETTISQGMCCIVS